MRKTLVTCFVIFMAAGSLHAQSADGAAIDHATMDHSAHMKMMAQAKRQAEVSERGKEVMPFKLEATTHIFSKQSDGGIQHVVAKSSKDTAQVRFVRQHLQQIQEEFLKGDFSGPTRIHGQSMPGLAQLQSDKSGQIIIKYKNVEGGGELTYKKIEPSLVIALHAWFDAQLSDHGKDAMPGQGQQDRMKRP
jgi:hypothetical protein